MFLKIEVLRLHQCWC